MKIDDVIAAVGAEEMGLRGRFVRKQRQQMLFDLEELLRHALESPMITFGDPGSRENNPFGVKFLEGTTVESEAFLKGFVLAGLMDNWREREKAAAHFQVTLNGEPLVIGGGETYITDLDKLGELGLTEKEVADRVFSGRELDHLRELGIILGEQSATGTVRRADGVYFRRMPGLGVSDDTALIYLGKTYGIDAMCGAFMADAADTYDKYVEVYTEGGHDERMVRSILGRLSGESPFVSETEIRRLIYFSAKANDPPVDVSSSHRRLIQVEPGARVSTYANHVAFVEGKVPARIPLGYNRYDSRKFYERITLRADVLRLGWNVRPSR